MKKKTIYFASSNKDKLREVKSIFLLTLPKPPKDLIIKPAPKGFSAKEDGKSFIENAYKKANKLSKKLKAITFSDDSGLEVKALNGKPGIKSSRFFKNGKGMLEIVEKIKNKKDKSCCFTCAVVVTDEKGKIVFKTQKSWHGKIANEPKGKNGFGYDPIFLVPKLNKTSAQLSSKQKNKLSHRYMAIKAFSAWLQRAYKKNVN